jgi:hypothetical protein
MKYFGLPLVAAVFVLTSCTDYPRIMASAFNDTQVMMISDFQQMGYKLTDIEYSDKMTRHAIDDYQRYNYEINMNNASEPMLRNDQIFVNRDQICNTTYYFVGEQGDSICFSVSYRNGYEASKKMSYVTIIKNEGCETSNYKMYDRLCGDTSPIQRLLNLSKDTAAVL